MRSRLIRRILSVVPVLVLSLWATPQRLGMQPSQSAAPSQIRSKTGEANPAATRHSETGESTHVQAVSPAADQRPDTMQIPAERASPSQATRLSKSGDLNIFFDLLANGQQVVARSEVDPCLHPWFDWIAERAGVPDERLTREQFLHGMQQPAGQRSSKAVPASPTGGDLSREEVRTLSDNEGKEIEEAFRRYDQNGDGLLNVDEMPESLLAELEIWDVNQDSLIDRSEFKAFYLDQWPQENAARGTDSNQKRQASNANETARFRPFEEEGDKPIVYRTGKLPKELPSWFGQMDTDHDGQIGLYEWKASGRSLEEFQWLDRNDDGFVTIEEVLHAVTQARNQPGGDHSIGPVHE